MVVVLYGISIIEPMSFSMLSVVQAIVWMGFIVVHYNCKYGHLGFHIDTKKNIL
jgi:hypothetical protein